MKGNAALIFLFIVAISCSVFENENNKLAYRWDKDALIVENGSQDTLYYAIFEQESLVLIDWIPFSSPENELLPNSFIRINSNVIPEYEDKVVLFYWKGAEPPYEDFKNVVIKS